MSSPASDPGKGSAPSLVARIDALERETVALTAALGLAQRVRFLITLLLVAFVGLTITIFYKKAKQVTTPQNLEQLRMLAEAKLRGRQDQLIGHVQTLANRAGPKLTEAFYAQAVKDSDKYLQGIERQRDQFTANLQAHLQTRLAERVQESLDRHEKLLAEEFPVAQNQELHDRMMNNVEEALRRLSKKYYADQLEEQMKLLYGNWDLFPPADPPDPGQPSIAEQLIGSLLDLLVIKLKQTEFAVAEASPLAP